MTREISVGLAGCGVVGGALVRLLHESEPAVRERYGITFALSSVLVRDTSRDRCLPLPSSLYTSDRGAFIENEVDIVVEATGNAEAASEIARSALGRGKTFVTANKELIAREGDELASIAHSSCAALDFGASVGGSAPVIPLLRDLIGVSTPKSVRGILNGTSNYVLSLLERGVTLDEALSSARQRGLAEQDASRDLDGRDVAAKLAIVAWVAYGVSPQALQVPRYGIGASTQALIEAAASLGGRVRLLGECRAISDRRIAAFVEPVVVGRDHAFARTEFEDNRVEVDLGWPAPLSVSGPGAGGAPTATALLGDLLKAASPAVNRPVTHDAFKCGPDPRTHRWLVARRDRYEVLTARRDELQARLERDGLDRATTAIARLEILANSAELA
jgi:homoserine dehydrogenase